MKNTTLLLTIVTVTYNAEKDIAKTIESILKCGTDCVEYIIIDGASKDRTIEIIKNYQTYFVKKNINYHFISEPDQGIYDAMNKAIEIAKGRFILNINCGDELLCIPYKILEAHIDDDYSGLSFPVYLDNYKNTLKPRYDKKLKYQNTIPHQGMFYKNTINHKYVISYKVFSDFDYNQKLYKDNKKIKIHNAPIVSLHKNDGISNERKYISELYKIIKKNYGIYYLCKCFIFFKMKGLVYRVNYWRKESMR